MDNKTLNITFKNPFNNKLVIYTFGFFVTKYDNSSRLEFIFRDNVLTYIPVDSLICIESLSDGVWKTKSTWSIYADTSEYIYFDELLNRVTLRGYYSLWENSKGEKFMSQANFVPRFGNFGLAISKIKIDGDSLFLNTYSRNHNKKTIQVLNHQYNKVPFKKIQNKPWRKKFSVQKHALNTQCKK